ncbi:MAG: hypothetical protein PHW60_09260 [Kiritimatiellae bacterium]|nr:hypothetical protein [Kiritimatiellia bacterium]
MKPNKPVDRVERALWNAGHTPEPFAVSAEWHAKVMAEIRRIGPLGAPLSCRTDEPATAWTWAAAVAVCLAIGIGWYAFNDLNTDAVSAGLFLDDPAGWPISMMMVEM